MTKPRKQPERCSQCRGVGQVPNPDHRRSGMVTCPTCSGSGTN